ncbi:MAG: molybdopterin-dependent oxidoreductase [Chloroflexi bacterium]|nr:molybdopterin-dependent oxidoreductase [Chloroflexota bacterium]
MKARWQWLLSGGLGVGLIAGFLASFTMLALRFALGTPSLQEVLTDKLVSLMSPQTFEFLLQHTFHLGKALSVLGFTVALGIGGGLVGLAFVAALRQRLDAWDQKTRIAVGFAFGAVLWLLTVLVLVPLAGGGFLGADVPGGGLSFLFATLVAMVLYGVTLAWLVGEKKPVTSTEGALPSAQGMSRRAFIKRAIFFIVVIAGVGFGLRSIVSGITAATRTAKMNLRDAGVLPPDVTLTERFYVVSKNFVDPTVNANTWRLLVQGMVNQPLTLTHDEVTAMAASERYQTLECISNEVGGDLISTAKWKGISLRGLLEQAGLKDGVKFIAFFATDGYSESVPLDVAMDPEVLLVHQMNGEPLTREHGFPARLLIPGRYGMKNPKWVERIEAQSEEYTGYWEERGWDKVAEVRTMSEVLAPADGTTTTAGVYRIGGVAFSGAKGISKVEFSLDSGNTWLPGTLKLALGPYTWVLWTADWTPKPGRYKLVVRAADGKGTPQDPTPRSPAPSGATGYHSINVEVS